MPAVVLIGAQWGDEGKGKITDYLAAYADLVVRYQGGANAGHTVIVNGMEFKLHLVPSGIFYPGKLCLIGNGVAIDPGLLIQEIANLQKQGVDVSGLRISDLAHLVMPYHRLLDNLEEERRGNNKIGTTGRGIGPAYMDKAARSGLRIIDLLDADEFASRLQEVLTEKNVLLQKAYNHPGLDYEEVLCEYQVYSRQLRQYVTDTSIEINRAIDGGKSILFEGAQGTLLDVDHGTYPYVTSSHPTAGGALIGTGVGPTRIDKVIGVAKAYTTRVGEGPFPTELRNRGERIGNLIRERGKEYGTTTGRPRRCGWVDAVILRYAVRISGLEALAITKLDVLDTMEKVKICTSYRYQGELLTEMPHSLKVQAQCEPVYEELDGWHEPTAGARSLSDLPPAARSYIDRLEELAGARVALLAVGPDRSQTIVCENIFA